MVGGGHPILSTTRWHNQESWICHSALLPGRGANIQRANLKMSAQPSSMAELLSARSC